MQDLNTGLKYLVNQNDPKAVKAFRTGRGRAYVQSLVPADGYTGAATNQTVKIVLGNDLTTVVDGSIALRLDGATVTPTINKSGTTTTVTYKEPSGYAFGSDHKGTLIWSEGTTPQTTWTNNFSFSVMLETPDDLPANSFWIEAEDFDSTGTPVPASLSTMPYDVGVSMPYDGIGATSGVDYSNNDSHENTNPTTYRSAGDPDTDGRSVDLTTTNGRYATRRPGGFDMTADYRIGWVDDGEWYNYTRNVAPGIYTAVAALSHGDARGTPHDLRGKLSIVTSGVGTTTQTLKDVGTFDAPSSGAWGDNDLVPMKAADGSEAVFKLAGAGPTTLRFTTGSGDYDWFALVPRNSVAPVLTSLTPPTDLTVYRDSKFTWTIEDFSTAVQAGSITLRFADADVTSQLAIAKPTSDTTTVSYQPAQLLDFGKPYSYELAFKDNGNPPKTKTITGTIVAHYLPNPPAGCFAIEAEDFNYNSGQTRPGINQMPYFGGAYDTLSAVAGIDYQRSSTVPDGDVYRLTETPNVPMGAALGTTQERPGTVPDVNRAGWDMTANFSLGWAGSGNWENYTRDIPTNIYQFWAAMSYDGRSADQLTGNLLKVTAGATTAQQTTELLGTFRAPGTGGWGANSLDRVKAQ